MVLFADVASDVRVAVRTMRKTVLVSATIVLCLGFGIGAVGTAFAWMETLVLQPLPGVSGLSRLASLKTTTSTGNGNTLSYPELRDVRDADARAGARAFSGISAFQMRRFTVGTGASTDSRFAEPIWGALTTANYFDVIGVRPIAGRGFAAEDDAVVGGAPIVVISHNFWLRRFGGDRAVLGRRLWLNGREMTIVGVAPPEFSGTIARIGLDLWIPVTMHGEVGGFSGIFEVRDARWLSVFGRLAPGVSLESARAAMQTIGGQLAANHRENQDRGLTAQALDVGPVDRIAPLFTVLLAFSVLVLLIVCSNVANLLLQRGAAREHEIAVRLALGAGRARLVRQLMTESLMLAGGGLLVGAVLIVWMRNAFWALVPPTMPLPVLTDTPIDLRVVIVLSAVGVSTIFAFGLAPALRSTRVDVRASLAAGGTRSGSRAGGWLRGALVAAQFALSLAVLVTAGLFLRRLDEVQRVDRGFREPDQVALVTVDFSMSTVRDEASRREMVDRIVEQMRALPGVRSAAAASFVPLGLLGYSSMDVAVPGYVPRSGESMAVLTNRVTDGYFATMGIPIVRGRPIEASDRDVSRRVAVVNEAFVQRFWSAHEPVGSRIEVDGREATVVGVAGDGKYFWLDPLDAPSQPFVYLAFAQSTYFSIVLHARANGPPLGLVPSIRRVVTAVDSQLTAISPSTLEDYSAAPYFMSRFGSQMLSTLGAAALLLATVGLYAVTAYTVTQQRREIGIRMALGATPAWVVRHFLIFAARHAGAGALVGAALAVALSNVMARHAPGTIPHAGGSRVAPFLAAAIGLTAVAAVAAFIPANRAARLNPTTALRED